MTMEPTTQVVNHDAARLPKIAPGMTCARRDGEAYCHRQAVGFLIPHDDPAPLLSAHCEPCATFIIDEYRDKLGFEWRFQRVIDRPADELDLIGKVRAFLGSTLADEGSETGAVVTMEIAEGLGAIFEANTPDFDFAAWRLGCGYKVRDDDSFEYLT